MKTMCKRFLALMLTLFLLCGANSAGLGALLTLEASAASSGICGDNLTWTLNNAGKFTIRGTGEIMDFTNKWVAPWSSVRSSIRVVVIESGVTGIGNRAFYSCENLTSVTIPEDVTRIGSYAFYGCSRLASVTIPDGVPCIEDHTFFNCAKLANVTIPESVASIGSYAFYGCSSLASVTIPDGVPCIEDYTFYNCTNLANVTLPENMTSIGSYAFYGCSSLASVTIPDGVPCIERCTFYNCKNLANVTISESVTSIREYAFSKCSSLTQVTIPGSVRTIEYNAFDMCTSLTSAIILDGMTSIGSRVFDGCTRLASVQLPDSLTKIGGGAFRNTALFQNDSNWTQGVLYIDNHLIEAKQTVSGSYVVKPGTKTIATAALSECNNLTSITLPDSITGLGAAFYAGTALSSIYFMGTLRQWCDILRDGYSYSPRQYDAQLYIDGTLLTEVAFPEGMTHIGTALAGYTHLERVTLPDSVTSIDSHAFYGCSSLESVTLPDSLTGIGYSAFENCVNLKEIILPNSLTSLGTDAFRGCRSLTNIVIPGSVTDWGYSTFSCCDALETVNLCDGLQVIPEYAFYECTSLSRLSFTDSITTIFHDAFSDCPLSQICYDGTLYSWYNLTMEDGNEAIEAVEPSLHKHDMAQAKYIGRVEPGCTTPGFTGDYGFETCGFILRRGKTIPAAHQYTAVVTAPTCTAKGYTTHTCNVCGEVTIDSETVPCGHVWDDGVVIEQPTCTEDGTKLFTCQNDHTHTRTEPLDAIGHDYSRVTSGKRPTCTENGFDIATCAHDETHTCLIPTYATGHSYTTAVTVPTCTQKGYTTHTCCVCGDSYTDNETEMLGHTFGAWTQTQEPTVFIQGEEICTCTTCGEKEVRKLDKLPMPVVEIKDFEANKTVEYRTSVTFTATVENGVDGGAVHWFINGKDMGTGEICTVNEAKDSFHIQVRYMCRGQILSESGVKTVTVKKSFLDKLKAFLRTLFGLLGKAARKYLGVERMDATGVLR